MYDWWMLKSKSGTSIQYTSIFFIRLIFRTIFLLSCTPTYLRHCDSLIRIRSHFCFLFFRVARKWNERLSIFIWYYINEMMATHNILWLLLYKVAKWIARVKCLKNWVAKHYFLIFLRHTAWNVNNSQTFTNSSHSIASLSTRSRYFQLQPNKHTHSINVAHEIFI